MKEKPIKQRILDAYERRITYYELMRAVFPEDKYPRAWRISNNGGPPGCAMAFGNAIRKMGGTVIDEPNGERTVYIPNK